jgi:hypothetical protein
MKHLALILGLGALVAPGISWSAPAQTATWTRGCQAGSTASVLSGGTYACYTPASGADDESASPILDVSQCENIDIFLFDDFDGDATACTVTWTIESCPPGSGALATDALKNAACNTLPGTASLTGDDVESNLAAHLVRVHGDNAGAAINSCRIVLKCALEGSK